MDELGLAILDEILSSKIQSWGVMGDVDLGILFDFCVKYKKERSPLPEESAIDLYDCDNSF